MVRPTHPGPAVAQLLEDETVALDGFPVRPLVQAWLQPRSLSDTRLDSAAGFFLLQVLKRWTSDLARQSAETLRGGSMAISAIHQRTSASHEALANLLALVEKALLNDATARALQARFTAAITAVPEHEPATALAAKARGAVIGGLLPLKD